MSIPSANVFESSDYAGPFSSRNAAVNVVPIDDNMDPYELPEGFQVPMMYTDDEMAGLSGTAQNVSFSGGTLSDNIRSTGGFNPRSRRRYRSRRPTRTFKRTRRSTYKKKVTKKRKPYRKNVRRVRRRTVPVRRAPFHSRSTIYIN